MQKSGNERHRLDSSSFAPPPDRVRARVPTSNLRNRTIFRAADEEEANESADFLGKKKVIKKAWGNADGRSILCEPDGNHIEL